MPTLLQRSQMATSPPTSREPKAPELALRSIVAVAILLGCSLAPAVSELIPGLTAWLNAPTHTDWQLLTLAAIGLFGLSTVLALTIVAALMRWWDRRPFSRIGLTPSMSGLAWFLAMVATGAIIGIVPAAVTGNIGPAAIPEGTPLWSGILIALATGFLLQAIPEETIFRGWLLQSFGSRRLAGLIATTLLFTVIHLISQGGQQNLGDQILYLAVPLGFGFTAAVVRLVTGSLWGAIGVHGGFHVGGFLAETFAPDLNPPWLWVTYGLAWAAVGAVILISNRGLAPRSTTDF